MLVFAQLKGMLDVVVFLEHDWNPPRDLQAMDRAHRPGYVWWDLTESDKEQPTDDLTHPASAARCRAPTI